MPQTRNSISKKQSRLAFTPLPSSSPDPTFSRAAAIRYEPVLTPRNLNPKSKSASRVGSENMTLPTPVASSQLDQNEKDVNEFSSASESTFQSDTEVRISSKTFGRIARPVGRTSYTEPVTSNPPKKSGSKEFLPTAAEFTKAKSGSSHNICGSSDEGDVPVSSSVQRKARPSAIYSSSEDESDPVLPKLGSRRRASKLPVPNSPNPQLPHTPTSSRVRPLGFILGGNTGNAPLSRSQRYKTEPRSIGRKIDDQDSKVSRRTRSHITENLEFDSPKRKVRPSTSSYNDLNRNTTESDTDEEDDEITQTPSKKSNSNAGLAPTRNLNTGDSDESSEDLVISPKRRRLVAKNFEDPPQNELDDSHNQIAEDLQADMDDLRDTEIHKRRTRGRAVNSKKSAKQEQLEILKRRRAGANTIELSSDSDAVPLSSSFRGTKHSYDQVSEEDEISDMEAVRQSLRAGEDDEDSFVENDDIDTLGAPDWRNEIPLEFTVHNMQKPIKNFKVAVEWMIHNKLNPAFARNDTIYKMAVTKLDDEVQGYSGSKFLSPVWNKEFLRILKEFPELSIIDVPTMLEHKCDACNRSGHPAKHQLTFSGEAYDRRTLESLSSDEDSEDQSEERSNNKESPTFYLGRTCAANAETGHNLYHWRYDLNFYVINWLKCQGHLSPEKILERAEWSTKKREKYSNEVVDEMEESGELRTLYEEFKQNLEAARTARPERFTYSRK